MCFLDPLRQTTAVSSHWFFLGQPCFHIGIRPRFQFKFGILIIRSTADTDTVGEDSSRLDLHGTDKTPQKTVDKISLRALAAW